MATSKERLLQTKDKIAKKQALIEKYEKQIAKMESEIKAKGWNPDDRYCCQGTESHIDCYWKICELDTKREALKSAKRALDELYRVLDGWEKRVKKDEEKNLVLSEMPEIFKNLKIQLSDEWFKWDVNMREDVREAFVDYENQAKALPNDENKRKLQRELRKTLIDDKFSKRSLELRFMKDEEIRKATDKEAESAIMELYYHVMDVTGKITGWESVSLHCGKLNGIIKGEEGKARVETIGAGGWNIQRYHFRTLVHAM